MSLKQGGRVFRAVAWRAAEQQDYLAEHKAALDVAFSLEQNHFNGETHLELTLADLRRAEPPADCSMTTFQRRARLFVAIFAVGFAVALGFAFKRRIPAPARPTVTRTDPNAIVESTSGRVVKVSRSREDVSIQYEKQLTYKDGATKLQGVTIVTTDRNDGRSFTVTGKGKARRTERVGNGVARRRSSGGERRLSATTEHATYTESEGRAVAGAGRISARNRLSGSGVGMTYDKNQDVLVILEQARVRMTPNKTAPARPRSARRPPPSRVVTNTCASNAASRRCAVDRSSSPTTPWRI